MSMKSHFTLETLKLKLNNSLVFFAFFYAWLSQSSTLTATEGIPIIKLQSLQRNVVQAVLKRAKKTHTGDAGTNTLEENRSQWDNSRKFQQLELCSEQLKAALLYLQWCALSGLMLQHFGHLYTTCPGLSCRLSMNSLVAFPLGTAPCETEGGNEK